MELKSEPKTIEVHFTDIDVAYPGETVSMSLEDGKDRYELAANGDLMVSRASGEALRFRTELMHWMSIRPRVQKRKIEEPK